MEKELILYIENHGIAIIISIVVILTFYRYFAPFMREAIKTQKEMTKFMQSMNMNIMRGKGLEMALNLKTQDLRWSLQKKIINYVIINNIDIHWHIIKKEIDLRIEEKLHNMFMDLRDIVEKSVLNMYLSNLSEELNTTKTLIIQLLEDLKEHGKEDRTLYEAAQRSIETHFEHFETRMYNKIKDMLN